MYVDDIIFWSELEEMGQKISQEMQNEFEMSMLSELTFFLGLQIAQDEKGIFISQSKYLREKLKQFGMEYCKLVCTPIVTSCNDESPYVNQSMYHSMIGSLFYLIDSRPDIMQVVGFLSRFQANPKKTHLNVVKRIFKYLQGTLDYGLWYPKGKNFKSITFTNVDSIDDRKSTLGAAHFLGVSLVSWERKKQISISFSMS